MQFASVEKKNQFMRAVEETVGDGYGFLQHEVDYIDRKGPDGFMKFLEP